MYNTHVYIYIHMHHVHILICKYMCVGTFFRISPNNIVANFWLLVWTMIMAKEVSKKSAFKTNIDISTVFKGILWIWTSLQDDQPLTSLFLYSRVMTGAFHFLTEIKYACFISWRIQCVRSVQIRSFFWSVLSCIQSKYRKIRTRINFAFGHFPRCGSEQEMQLAEIYT